jgi:hypothetical protein
MAPHDDGIAAEALGVPRDGLGDRADERFLGVGNARIAQRRVRLCEDRFAMGAL